VVLVVLYAPVVGVGEEDYFVFYQPGILEAVNKFLVLRKSNQQVSEGLKVFVKQGQLKIGFKVRTNHKVGFLVLPHNLMITVVNLEVCGRSGLKFEGLGVQHSLSQGQTKQENKEQRGAG
jgi:hypothetical protein